jgi:hypothetical protein
VINSGPQRPTLLLLCLIDIRSNWAERALHTVARRNFSSSAVNPSIGRCWSIGAGER